MFMEAHWVTLLTGDRIVQEFFYNDDNVLFCVLFSKLEHIAHHKVKNKAQSI